MSDLSRFEWSINHENRIIFVMIDGSGNEVAGLGAALTMFISKNGGALAPVAGTITEIGMGLYSYLSSIGEADTVGPVGIVSTGAGTIQQNLEYVVSNRLQNTKSYTYPVEAPLGTPVVGAKVEIYTVSPKTGWIWSGTTDEFGHPRDAYGALPVLQIGKIYYFWTSKVGIVFPNPDAETIS